MSKETCPVCGFLMDYPASNFNICPSCGVEFGAETIDFTFEELRQSWIKRGMIWSSRVLPRPAHYNPGAQLERLRPEADAAHKPRH